MEFYCNEYYYYLGRNTLHVLNQLIRNSAMQQLCFIFLPVMTTYADNTFVTSCRLHLSLCVPA